MAPWVDMGTFIKNTAPVKLQSPFPTGGGHGARVHVSACVCGRACAQTETILAEKSFSETQR